MAETDDTQPASAEEAGTTGERSADQAEDKRKRSPFTFTDDGCRSEIRVGALLILAAVFLWLWLGPAWSSRLYFIGLPLLLIGVPLQVRDQRRIARPGFPLKLGLVFALGGALMWPDLLYRESVDGAVAVQPVAPLLVVAGVWILAWWPVSRLRPAGATAGGGDGEA
ncbi:MAG: hypothetical protein ACOCZK_06540 [Planctomycetota bacterium]